MNQAVMYYVCAMFFLLWMLSASSAVRWRRMSQANLDGWSDTLDSYEELIIELEKARERGDNYLAALTKSWEQRDIDEADWWKRG